MKNLSKTQWERVIASFTAVAEMNGEDMDIIHALLEERELADYQAKQEGATDDEKNRK